MPKPAVNIPLPKSWPAKVCAAMLHVVSLAKYAAVYTRSWAADSRNARVRLRADNDRLLHEVALLREEIRIKDARMVSLPPHRRPFYPPSARLAILELRAARGWSLEQTAATPRLRALCRPAPADLVPHAGQTAIGQSSGAGGLTPGNDNYRPHAQGEAPASTTTARNTRSTRTSS